MEYEMECEIKAYQNSGRRPTLAQIRLESLITPHIEDLDQASKKELLKELHSSCTYDYKERFQRAHDQLKKHKLLDYRDKDFNFTVSEMDNTNMLLFAMAMNAWEISEFLIEEGGSDLVMEQCGEGSMKGTTALHLAIASDRTGTIHKIMGVLEDEDKKKLIEMESTGIFFKKHFSNNTKPITLSLYCGFEKVFYALVSYGGDLESVNTHSGNGIVHALVEYGVGESKKPKKSAEILKNILESKAAKEWYCKKYDIFDQKISASDHNDLKSKLLKLENNERYNALAYSAKLGVHDLLISIMNSEGVYMDTMWNLGSCQVASYKITEIDPTVGKMARLEKPFVEKMKRPNDHCVLELLLYSDKKSDRVPSLSEEPLQTLLNVKWNMFRVPYMVLAFVHLIVICVQTYLAVRYCKLENDQYAYNSSDKYPVIEYMGFHCYITKIGFWVVTMLVSLYLLEEITEIVNAFRSYARSKENTPWSIILKFDQYDIIMSIYGISSLVFLPGTINTSTYTGDVRALAIALASGWYFMLCYTKAFRPTSFFATMISRMLFTHLIRFSVALAVFIVGFGVAIMALVSHTPLPDGFSSFSECVETMILILVGMADLEFLETSPYPQLSKIMTILYIIIGTILLMNTLISAMTDTYSHLSNYKEDYCLKVKLSTIMLIERRFPSFFLRRRVESSDQIKKDQIKKESDNIEYSITVETKGESIDKPNTFKKVFNTLNANFQE